MDAVHAEASSYRSDPNRITFDHVMIDDESGWSQYSHTNYSLVTDDPDDPVYQIFAGHLPPDTHDRARKVGSVIDVGGYRFRIVDYDPLSLTFLGVLDSRAAFLHVWRSQWRHHWLLFKARCAITRRIWFGQ